ncbi:hypothetical protein TB2_027754 [Malus domestica]
MLTLIWYFGVNVTFPGNSELFVFEYCIRNHIPPCVFNHVLLPADSKTLKEEKREELFENLNADESIGWVVDVIDPRELSAKMLKKRKINLNEILHDSAMDLVTKVLNMGVLLTETALRERVLEETAEELHKGFGSGYPGDPNTKAWLEHHKHFVFGFPSLVRFLRIS